MDTKCRGLLITLEFARQSDDGEDFDMTNDAERNAGALSARPSSGLEEFYIPGEVVLV